MQTTTALRKRLPVRHLGRVVRAIVVFAAQNAWRLLVHDVVHSGRRGIVFRRVGRAGNDVVERYDRLIVFDDPRLLLLDRHQNVVAAQAMINIGVAGTQLIIAGTFQTFVDVNCLFVMNECINQSCLYLVGIKLPAISRVFDGDVLAVGRG